MITVLATREGLIGGQTSSGYIIDTVVTFCALPTPHALGRHVRITNPTSGKSCIAQVLDVGPWNIKDDAYVFQFQTSPRKMGMFNAPTIEEAREIRPQAETGFDMFNPPRKTNFAGIDLSESAWKLLGMKDNGLVSWEFL